jgi:hypothetical protein
MWSCEVDPSEVPYRMELRVNSLESAMLKGQKEIVMIEAGEVIKMIEENPFADKADIRKQNDVIRILKDIQANSFNDRDFEDIRIVKELLLELYDFRSYHDDFLDALWVYGNDLLLTTNTARDQLLDLYEWREFEDQVLKLKSSWGILQRLYPSPELLRYNEKKEKALKTQFILLSEAQEVFFDGVENKEATTYDLCSNADVLRDVYQKYIELLSSVSIEQRSDENLY